MRKSNDSDSVSPTGIVDRWQEVERVFLAAAELPPADRAAFVKRETHGDNDLRAAVEGMLRHSDAGGPLFQETVQHAVASVVEPEPGSADSGSARAGRRAVVSRDSRSGRRSLQGVGQGTLRLDLTSHETGQRLHYRCSPARGDSSCHEKSATTGR